jgi:hypothetical protein
MKRFVFLPLIVGTILVTVLIMSAVENHKETTQAVENKNKEVLSLVETFPRFANDTALSLDERVELLRIHNDITTEQDAQLTIIENTHNEKISKATSDGFSNTISGIVIAFLTLVSVLVLNDSRDD